MSVTKKAIVIWPDEVKSYAASAALEEARRKGWLTYEQVQTIADRANLFMEALTVGKVLRPTDTGYDIMDRDAVKDEIDGLEDGDNIVIEA